MTRRLLTFLVAVLLTVPLWSAGLNAASTQGPTWVRGCPSEENPVFGMTAGCVYYVAQWSDSSYTSVPWEYDPGVVTHEGTRTTSRGYPQFAENGCIEYVTQWSDGT